MTKNRGAVLATALIGVVLVGANVLPSAGSSHRRRSPPSF